MSASVDITLPSFARRTLAILEDAGFEAWCVGGFVRDALLERAGHDLDVATDASWRQAGDALRAAGCPVHETGTAYGTVTAIVEGNPVEVTTYRSDGPYRDSRHPDSVSFVTSIDEDLARRDFTVNAMAYHPRRGLRDPHGGGEDLRRGLVRAVGDADARFSEDALRILRGARFSSQLGFSIDQETFAAMGRNAGGLRAVAAERVRVELERLLLGPAAGPTLLKCAGILAQVLPELGPMEGCPQNTPYHRYGVLEHTAHVLDESPATPLSRWAALFHDAGKPACRTTDADGRDHFKGHAAVGGRIARAALGRLRAPRRLVEDVSLLVSRHECYTGGGRSPILRELREMGGRVDLYRALLDLQVADSRAKAEGVTERLDAARAARARLEAILAENPPLDRSGLAIDGRDLIDLGWTPGPPLGEMLDGLLDLVLDGLLENERGALLGYASAHSPR